MKHVESILCSSIGSFFGYLKGPSVPSNEFALIRLMVHRISEIYQAPPTSTGCSSNRTMGWFKNVVMKSSSHMINSIFMAGIV